MNKLFVLCLMISQSTYGFDTDLCRDFVHITGPASGSGFFSTTEFVSSFGRCSAFRESKIDKIKSFIITNREQLKNDFSRRSTETINSLIQICACNEPGQNYVASNFLEDLKSKINSEISNDQLKTYLEDIFRSDKTLYYGCLVYEPNI